MKCICFLIAVVWATFAHAAGKPNIIFMLSDDQAWNGLSVTMHPEIAGSRSEFFQTPNLVRLAAQGMRFSQAYAPAPVCSPTRISIQLGKSPAQLHWTKAAPPVAGQKLIEPRLIRNIDERETTIAELLKSAGYATAHYGKWHIAGGGPQAHGYHESDGDTGNETALKFKDPNPVDIFGMADRAAKFMEAQSKAGKPFYIQLSWHALHAPENALHATLAKYRTLMPGENEKRVTTAAMTEDLDTGVGRVLAAIDRLGLAGNTYVIYMADNGAGGGRRVLRGGKGGVWEGGIRVPFIIRGPGIAANAWCHSPIVGYDLLPTFCDWAGIDAAKLPKNIEGGSFAPLLANNGKGTVKRPREELVFHFPHYQDDDGPQSSILLGNLKLIHFYENDRVAMFDLSKDIAERTDLSAQMPKEAAALRDRLDKYLAAVNAQFATPNPDYDPAKPPAADTPGQGTPAGPGPAVQPRDRPGSAEYLDPAWRPRAAERELPPATRPALKGGLTVSSASVDAKGRLSVDCTCDGKRLSPAVEWKGAPAGTKSFAISVWHIAPGNVEKSYWVVYRIPADVTRLPQGVQNVGTLGLNDRRRAEYDPMCSKGPGVKTYHVTVYALSAEPDLPPEKATRAELLAAIKGITVADGTLDFTYERGTER